MAIDVYVWLTYKLQKRTPLRWPALYAQFGAGFATLKNLRLSFLDALAAATSPLPIPYRGGTRQRRLPAG